MRCLNVYFYGRGVLKETKQVAAALEEISIGRQCGDKYETSDLASLIFDMKDRIKVLEGKVCPQQPSTENG